MAPTSPVEAPSSATAEAAGTADPSAVASMSSPASSAPGAPGPSDQAPLEPLEATIRPPAVAATTPETGVLHHPHHQPTPQTESIATPATPDPAATTPAAAAIITTNTPTAAVPGASLAHPDNTKPTSDPERHWPSMLPSLPPPSSSSAAAPEAKTQPHHSTTASHASSSTSKMIFSDIYKSPRSPLSKFRHSMSQQPLSLDLPDYDPDLLSKDKLKQKEAVKKYLASKVRNDWEFVWPPVITPRPQNGDAAASQRAPAPAPDADAPAQDAVKQTQEPAEPNLEETATNAHEDDVAVESDEDDEEEDLSGSDAESVYSTISEDPARFKPRLEWVSDLSDEEEPLPLSLSPFRFDTPDAIGAAVKASVAEKRAGRRRALREEMQWNEGLACFEARRNAWTGARTVHVRAKPASPTQTFSPLSPRRLFFRSSMSQPSPAPLTASPASPPHSLQQRPSNDASAVVSDGSELTKEASKELAAQKSKESARSTATPASVALPIETLIPIPAPLLPPGNPMRASITPSVYISLYEKVIVHALTPSCPVNLSDMIRACVVGWKRDGEWPPKPTMADPSLVAVRRRKKSQNEGQNAVRRMSFGLLGRGEKAEGDDAGAGKGIRKSLQRVLGIGQHHHATATSANNGNGAANGKEAAAA